MKAPEEFVKEYYQLPQSKIETVRIKSLIKCVERFKQYYDSEVNKLNMSYIKDWRFFKDEMPKVGDEILIVWEQYPPERRVVREQDILHDWVGMRWMPIPAWR